MGPEGGYQPSPAEIRDAESTMSDEQRQATEKLEDERFAEKQKVEMAKKRVLSPALMLAEKARAMQEIPTEQLATSKEYRDFLSALVNVKDCADDIGGYKEAYPEHPAFQE